MAEKMEKAEKKSWKAAAEKSALDINGHIKAEAIHRLINLVPANRDEYLEKMEFCYNFGYTATPPQVFIELTSVCNLRCTICQYGDMKREMKKMDPTLARKAIDECAELGVYYVTFQFYGEPLTCPDFLIENIRYAKERGIPVVATVTNATLMTDDIMRGLVESGLDSLVFSFDGASAEKYKSIRNREHSDVAARIKSACRVRDSMNDIKQPFIGMTLVRTDEEEVAIDAFCNEWNDYVDHIDIRSMLLFHYRTKETASYEDSLDEWYITRDTDKRIPCRQLYQKLIVCSDGQVTPCCIDMDAALSVGNFRDKTLKELWQGEELANMRKLDRTGRFKEIPLCADCKDFDFCGAISEETIDEKVK
ncbi:MAG: SPASM domain-containing protein [Proteobacteria bacterium]|nr:SPASM domain-containing protein [Pseudomonadota bacterium]